MIPSPGSASPVLTPSITASPAQAPAPLAKTTPVPASPLAGSLTSFTYHSDALDADQTAQIYVPSGQAPDDGWPVLYLLHGLHGQATDWETLGGIRETLDDLIAEKKIKPLVVVMPNAGNSWYVDSADVDGPGDFATAIGTDLQQAVEHAYPVGTNRFHRAIGGLSMGGFGALRLALISPERYGAVAAMSPAIWQNIPMRDGQPVTDKAAARAYFQKFDPNTVTIGIDMPPEGSHFGGAFGSPFDPARFNAANVFTLLQQANDAKKHLPPIYLTVGDNDSHLLWRGAIAFFETMQMNRGWIDFRVTDGDHNWALWKQSVVDAVLFVDAKLNKIPVR